MNLIRECKEWLKDCYSEDSHDEIEQSADQKILKAIEIEYAGGLKQFRKDGQ